MYNACMNCPKCNTKMRKFSWQITNNGKKAAQYKEYDKNMYQCAVDDVWVTVETPLEVKVE